MEHKLVAPSPGESITEVRILKWNKADGQAVKTGEIVVEIESDKATLEVVAETNGALKIGKKEGELVKVGEVIGFVDDAAAGTASTAKAAPASMAVPTPTAPSSATASTSISHASLSPSVRRLTEENDVNPTQVAGTGKDGRLTKGDVLSHLERGASPAAPATSATPATPAAPKTPDRPGDRRVPMTRLRARIAERLVQAQHTAAILTTFNEVDMGPVMDLRAKHKEAFKAKNGVALSFMSFFTRAVTKALQQIPAVNASIDGNDVIYHDYYDVGIAVGTDRGLVVPVLRGTEKMSFLDIEKGINALAVKARDGKLSIQDMSGGTFTISNGGTYGSLMSTPILNPPQSAILGMHKIQERPMAVNGKVEIRPMMYLAVSYDHRLIDGKEAVTFLVHIKEALEKPESLGLDFI